MSRPDFNNVRNSLRVFATWRKDFVHYNKTRDNRAIQLGKRFQTTLMVRSDRKIGEHVRSTGINIVQIRCKLKMFSVIEFYIKVLLWFLREKERQSYDIIYSFLGEEPIGWILCKVFHSKAKWVVDLWDNPELIATKEWTFKHYLTKFYLWLLRKIINKAEIVISGILPYALDKYRIPNQRIVITTNGVDLRKFDMTAFERSTPVYPLRLLYVGHLMKERGVDCLIEACENLSNLVKGKFKLDLIGFRDKLNPNWVQEEVERRRLKETINIIGELDASEIPQRISDSDICIHPFPDKPGLSEIFPIKIYEYLAMNKVVVASDLPGVRTIVVEGENGLLFKPSSAKDLTEKLLILINDEHFRQKLAMNGRVSIEKYDWSLVLNNLFAEIQKHVQSV